ncbi:expressed unknown protein [Seminavis robusta]|uniref:DUF4116 domain-containing protein n=1 Tax=Seminavis robusta TaxID=568900 RepID=A0A9N8ECZ0_9STRA|nr:expressed unknown protein [Seminavis robusta]|eukprot:Sro819_g207110.1 n/a (467) ;mRNA; r:24430-26274
MESTPEKGGWEEKRCFFADDEEKSYEPPKKKAQNDLKPSSDFEFSGIPTMSVSQLLQIAEKCYEQHRHFLVKNDNYKYASERRRANKEIALAWLESEKDKEVVLTACSQDGNALEYAAPDLQNDKAVIVSACSNHGLALQYASQDLQNDVELVLLACSQHRDALKYAPEELLHDKGFMLQACAQDGNTFQYASQKLQNDKDVVLAACAQNGWMLQSVPECFQSLKFALGGLNQDRDCLIKARLWDDNYVDRNADTVTETQIKKKKIVLSTKFALGARTSAHATKFTVELKKHPYIAQSEFVVYSPNAFNKGTCDPQWTNKNWQCQGTYATCQKPPHLKTGVPKEAESCWRYSFRYHLSEASHLGGFMIQVVDLKKWEEFTWPLTNDDDDDGLYENHDLGDGQRIETKMARETGIKIFRFFEPVRMGPEHYSNWVHQFVLEIQKWYQEGGSNMTECNIVQQRNVRPC